MKSNSFSWPYGIFNEGLINEVIDGVKVKQESENFDHTDKFVDKWNKIKGGYRCRKNTPGIESCILAIHEGTNVLNLKAYKRWDTEDIRYDYDISLPVSLSEIEQIEHETLNGITTIIVQTKNPIKDIKIVDRTYKDEKELKTKEGGSITGND